jgi:hypothetical protein
LFRLRRSGRRRRLSHYRNRSSCQLEFSSVTNVFRVINIRRVHQQGWSATATAEHATGNQALCGMPIARTRIATHLCHGIESPNAPTRVSVRNRVTASSWRFWSVEAAPRSPAWRSPRVVAVNLNRPPQRTGGAGGRDARARSAEAVRNVPPFIEGRQGDHDLSWALRHRRTSTDAIIHVAIDGAGCCRFKAGSRRRTAALR